MKLIFFDYPAGIKTNARKEANIISPNTRYYLELDFWIPDLKLAFEYQVTFFFLISLIFLPPLSLLLFLFSFLKVIM